MISGYQHAQFEFKKKLRKLAKVFNGVKMDLKAINNLPEHNGSEALMPLLFVGHGNPMNAILQNEFTLGWQQAATALPKPVAILCISAHWETEGTFVTAVDKPRTIHDFYGFPKELFNVEYPAPGNITLAEETKSIITTTNVESDFKWGLDHGCWCVLKHLYPLADVPVIQLSLDYHKSPEMHYELAGELLSLRKKGVLIIGSGNIVHNLGLISWHDNQEYEWVAEANEKLKQLITSNDHRKLMAYKQLGNAVQLAIPTPEHFLPLLYILGLKNENEQISFFNDKTELGSISMTSLKIGY